MNKKQIPHEQAPPDNEVTFGARGFLSTLLGLIIGALLGFVLAVFLSNLLLKPTSADYDASVSFDKILMFWKIIGGVGGATLGAFIGILIGTTKREAN